MSVDFDWDSILPIDVGTYLENFDTCPMALKLALLLPLVAVVCGPYTKLTLGERDRCIDRPVNTYVIGNKSNFHFLIFFISLIISSNYVGNMTSNTISIGPIN